MKAYKVGKWRIEDIKITELMFADDMAMIADTKQNLQRNVNVFEEELENRWS